MQSHVYDLQATQPSAKAAKEIKELIGNSNVEVESGVQLVLSTGASLKTIAGKISAINLHMAAIATSTKEQSTGLAEVNSAVNAMGQTTQQNAAMVEQSTAASASLAFEAAKLRDLVPQFKLKAVAIPPILDPAAGGISQGGAKCGRSYRLVSSCRFRADAPARWPGSGRCQTRMGRVLSSGAQSREPGKASSACDNQRFAVMPRPTGNILIRALPTGLAAKFRR